MLSSLDAHSEKFLSDLSRINSRLANAQRQVSSGKRVSTASDAPDDISDLLQTRLELEQTVQTRANLGRLKAEVDTAESALQTAVKLAERALTLGLQGANDTQSAETRRGISAEVQAIFEEMVGLARTSVDGRFLFSGDFDQVPPYSLDSTTTPPVSLYQGAAATRHALHPNGSTFAVARTGEEVFNNTDPAKNAFAVIHRLVTGLQTNDDATIQQAMGELGTVGEHLNGQLAFYGSAQNRIASATESAHKKELSLKTAISGVEDADMTEAIVSMQQAQFSQQAALMVRAKAPQRSLFDYLG